MKKLGAKWLVQMSEYISENPNIVSNNFYKSWYYEDFTGRGDGDLDTFTDDEPSDDEAEMSDDEAEMRDNENE